MRFKPQPWQLIFFIAVICSLSIGGVVWYRSRTLTPAALLKRMPTSDALVLWIDFAELRRAGILDLLASAKAAEEPDFQAFMRAIQFDYMVDLDSVMWSMPPAGNYFFAKGHFDWKALTSYVEGRAGQCINSLCRVTGSTPDRRISFLPLRRDVMAMAVSHDEYGVMRLTASRPGPDPEVPSGPVWLMFPGSALARYFGQLPDGTQSFARILERAPNVSLSLTSDEQRQLSVKLDMRCRSHQDAVEAASQLTAATELARSMFAREHLTPRPADASKFITSGTFHSEGDRVSGTWPLEHAFVQNLLGSQ